MNEQADIIIVIFQAERLLSQHTATESPRRDCPGLGAGVGVAKAC